MGKILVKDKDIVVPGDILAEGMDYLPAGGAFRERDNIVSSQLGIVSISERLVRVIALSGKYVPKRVDNVIGKISTVAANNWFVDVGYANEGMLGLKEAVAEFVPRGADLTQYFRAGDYVLCKIINVTKQKLIDISMKGPGLRKLGPGRLIKVTPAKVPRMIGKAGSMIAIIKDLTACRVTIGQNGLAWVSGPSAERENLAVKALMLIEENSHKVGLTDEIKKFLEKEVKSLPKVEKVGPKAVVKKNV